MSGHRGRKVYAARRWKVLRLAKLRDVDYRCEECGRWTNEVHHRVPLVDGGPAFPPLSGLVALCEECHMDAHRDPAQVKRRRAWARLQDWVGRQQRYDSG